MLDRREPVGGLLRQWRQRRRLSQLDLACDAGISTRHLSFVETGRAHPSREMLLHLSEQLDVPVRERNVLLVAAGYAPMFPERPLADPALTADRALIDLLNEVSAYPTPPDRSGKTADVEHEIAVPFRITTGAGVLSFFSMTTVFGTPVDVMLAELALELFFPADDETAIAVQRMAATRRAQ